MSKKFIYITIFIIGISTITITNWRINNLDSINLNPQGHKKNPEKINSTHINSLKNEQKTKINDIFMQKNDSFQEANNIYEKIQLSSNRDEKLHLIGILASIASRPPNENTNEVALSQILSIAKNDKDNEVSSYATMIYSRTGDPEIALDLLKFSLSNNRIDQDIYYSELARIYLNTEIEGSSRVIILEEIINSNNDYTAEIIFSTISLQSALDLPTDEVEKLTLYLKENKPQFPSDFTSLGISDTIVYTNWLTSLATLSNNKNNPEFLVEYLLDYFSSGFSDPREAVSISLTNPIKNSSQSEKSKTLNKLIQDETLRYADSYPNNPVIQTINFSDLETHSAKKTPQATGR